MRDTACPLSTRGGGGLARIVDDDVEPHELVLDVRAERLERREVAEVDTVAVDARGELRKVVLEGVPAEGRGASDQYGVRDAACPLSTRGGGGGTAWPRRAAAGAE